MTDLSKTGVYCITNTRSGLRYVGSAAVAFSRRWATHKSALNSNTHHNPRLQRVWNKYGSSALVFVVLRYCDPSECLMWEQRFIEHFESSNPQLGYNFCPIAGNTLGRRHSESTRSKISAKAKQRFQAVDEREKVAAAKRGKPLSLEHRAKIGAAQRGRKKTVEHNQKNAAAQRGKSFSAEHRANLGNASRGRIRNVGSKRTPEQRARMSEAQRLIRLRRSES